MLQPRAAARGRLTTSTGSPSRFDLFTRAVLVLVLGFLIVPIGLIVVRGLPWLPEALRNIEMRAAIKLSLWTSVLSALVCLLLSVPAALALTRLPRRVKAVVEAVLYVPMALPHLIAGIALLLLYGRNGVGTWLYESFGVDFVFTKAGIVLAQIFINLPFSIKTIMQSLEEVDLKQIFVARTLGCSTLGSYWFVVVPQIRAGITTALVMNWSRGIGEFGAVMMLAGTTRLRTEVIPTSIYLNMAVGETGPALGLSTLLIGVTLMTIFSYLGAESARRST